VFDGSRRGLPATASSYCTGLVIVDEGATGVLDDEHVTRVLDPEDGRLLVPPLSPGESIVGLSSGGGLVVQGGGHVGMRDRSTGARFWDQSFVPQGLRWWDVLGDRIVVQTGRACDATCELVCLAEVDGRQTWRRACPCVDLALGYTAFTSMDVLGGRLIVAYDHWLEGWDALTGRVVWKRDYPEYCVDGGHLFVKTREPERIIRHALVTRLDPETGGDIGDFVLPSGCREVETMAADERTLFLACTDASPPGPPHEDRPSGRAHVAILGFDVDSRREVFRARWRAMNGSSVPAVEHNADHRPSLWVDDTSVSLFDPDTGILSAFDRATGETVSTLGVGGARVVGVDDGLVLLDDSSVALVKPSSDESPRLERATIQGTLRVDGKVRVGAAVLVGDVEVKTGTDGRFSASVLARGSIVVQARQPTSRQDRAFWADAQAVVSLDGRASPYSVEISAVGDSYD
jgi:hypothetical protein